VKKTRKVKKVVSSKNTKPKKSNLLTHIEKRLNEGEQKGIGMSDLVKIMQESKDTRDKVLGDMVNKLFDKDSLLAISILDTEMMYHILRHLIVLNYYVERWNGLSVDIFLTPSPEIYPYYHIDIKYNGDMTKKETESYKRFIDEMLLIRISLKGQGRADIKDIVRSAEQRLLQNDMMAEKKAGFMSKFM